MIKEAVNDIQISLICVAWQPDIFFFSFYYIFFIIYFHFFSDPTFLTDQAEVQLHLDKNVCFHWWVNAVFIIIQPFQQRW